MASITVRGWGIFDSRGNKIGSFQTDLLGDVLFAPNGSYPLTLQEMQDICDKLFESQRKDGLIGN